MLTLQTMRRKTFLLLGKLKVATIQIYSYVIPSAELKLSNQGKNKGYVSPLKVTNNTKKLIWNSTLNFIT